MKIKVTKKHIETASRLIRDGDIMPFHHPIVIALYEWNCFESITCDGDFIDLVFENEPYHYSLPEAVVKFCQSFLIRGKKTQPISFNLGADIINGKDWNDFLPKTSDVTESSERQSLHLECDLCVAADKPLPPDLLMRLENILPPKTRDYLNSVRNR